MKRFISSDKKWEVTRLSSKGIQVSNIKTYTSFVLDANVNTGTLGSCSCAFGRRAGTTCPHVIAQREFVAMEQAEKQAPVLVLATA